MKKLQIGNERLKQSDIEQVDDIIYAFMQIRAGFDAMLPGEMARIRGETGGPQVGREPAGGANGEVFFRTSTYLSRRGTMTMGELATALAVPMSTATRMADWMVENGYLHRLPEPQDRRVVRVALTGSGTEFHLRIQDGVRQRVRQILACLEPDERAALFGLVRKMASSSGGM